MKDQVMMIPIELIGEVPFYFAMGIKILTAVLLGGFIGLDREQKMKAAGIKTNVMICLGATLYTSISIVNYIGAGHNIGDINRIAAQVVSGIGFLGAGAIIQSKGEIIGLTTAATIWVVAAIGVTVGSGYPFSAFLFTITILIVLRMLEPLYKKFENNYVYYLDIIASGDVMDRAEPIVKEMASKIYTCEEEMLEEDGKRILHYEISISPKRLNLLLPEISSLFQVLDVSYRKVSKDIKLKIHT